MQEAALEAAGWGGREDARAPPSPPPPAGRSAESVLVARAPPCPTHASLVYIQMGLQVTFLKSL